MSLSLSVCLPASVPRSPLRLCISLSLSVSVSLSLSLSPSDSLSLSLSLTRLPSKLPLCLCRKLAVKTRNGLKQSELELECRAIRVVCSFQQTCKLVQRCDPNHTAFVIHRTHPALLAMTSMTCCSPPHPHLARAARTYIACTHMHTQTRLLTAVNPLQKSPLALLIFEHRSAKNTD